MIILGYGLLASIVHCEHYPLVFAPSYLFVISLATVVDGVWYGLDYFIALLVFAGFWLTTRDPIWNHWRLAVLIVLLVNIIVFNAYYYGGFG